MAEWQATSLGDLCAAIVDCEHKTAPVDAGGTFFAVGTPAMQGNTIDFSQARRISLDTFNGWTKRLLPRRGDLLLAREAPVGPVVRIPREENVAPGQRTVLLRPDPERADSGFLYYLLTSGPIQARMLSMAEGSTVSHLNVADVRVLGLVAPPDVEEQRAIAEVLGALDDKIDANTRLAALSDELARTTARRGLSRSTESVRLGDLVTVTKGVSYRSADLVPADTALVTLKSFSRDGSYAARGLKSYAGDFRAEQVVATGDLAVAQTDLTQAAEVVGRVVSVPPAEEFKTLVASLDLAIVRPKAGVPRGYLLGLLWQDDFRLHCREHTSGTTVLHLARGAIESYVAPRLPADAMKSIADEVEPLASVAPRIHADSLALAATRDALLPALMSGKLRVRDAERLAEAHT